MRRDVEKSLFRNDNRTDSLTTLFLLLPSMKNDLIDSLELILSLLNTFLVSTLQYRLSAAYVTGYVETRN